MTGPLERIRVLDLSHTIAGLSSTMLLGGMGAEVIKVEQKEAGAKGGKGIPSRVPTFWRVGNIDLRFVFLNNNKKSVTLDLKSPEGKDIFYKLVGKSDVVVDNFRPAVLERLGIQYSKLKQINPRIVSCSISGFNPKGPYGDLPAFDQTVQGISGLLSMIREEGRDPLFLPFYLTDVFTSLFATTAIMTALYDREVTSTGQKVELSLLGSGLFLLFYEGVMFLNTGAQPLPTTSKSRQPAFGIFKTRDGYLAVAAASEAQVQSLCNVIGQPDLIKEPRFDSPLKRVENKEILNRIIEDKLADKDTVYWLDAFTRADLPSAGMNSLEQAFFDPRVKAENVVGEVTYQGKNLKVLTNPIRMSKYNWSKPGPPPELGEQSESVLKDLLSLSGAQIEELKRKGVV